MASQNTPKSLSNLQRHQIGTFLIPLLQRKETIEETVSYFDATRTPSENSGLLCRASHLFTNKENSFDNLVNVLKSNNNFTDIKVLHESSDIGLPYKLYLQHKNGKIIYYDGIMYRLTEIVEKSIFGLDEIEKKTSYGTLFDPVVLNFEESLLQVIPLPHIYSHNSYSFYTADVIDWNSIGIEAKNDPHLHLVCKDPNFITFTALIFSEVGKEYNLFLGDHKTALQMIAHDRFISYELSELDKLLQQKRTKLQTIEIATNDELTGIISSFIRLFRKHKSWNSLKNNWLSIGNLKSIFTQFDLIIQSYTYIIEQKWAFFNGPRQIWLSGEIKDNQEQIQHPCTNFYTGKFDKNKIIEVSNLPDKPKYSYQFEEIERLASIIKSEIKPLVESENVLLTIFQTEFTLYAVWFGVIAVIISVISIVISLCN